MMKRLLALLALGVVLTACGGAPRYTIRQAVIDMPEYEASGQFYDTTWANCVASYLFHRLHPFEVKAIVQGADLGYSPPVMALAVYYCDGSPVRGPEPRGFVPKSSAELGSPSTKPPRAP